MGQSIVTEVRAAVRGLLRAPAVSLSAVLCIALGLGTTAAIFSAVDRALVRALPFPASERLVTVYRTTPHFDTGPFSAPNYSDLARDSRRIAELAAITPRGGLLTLADEAVQVDVKRATGNLFPMLGVAAQGGRLLLPDDDRAGADPVAVVSDELWRERFAADPALVGRAIRLDGEPYTVVGIAPPDLGIPHGAQVIRAELWVPMRFSDGELSRRRSNFLWTMGRLAPAATIETAHAELRQLFGGIAAAHPELRGEQVRVLPLQAEGVRAVRTPLLLLLGAVGIVLLIAATNVAALLLARAVQRRREIAVRTAIGGTRGQVMRPVLVESLVVTVVGLLLGLAVAWAAVRTIGALAAERLPQLAGLGIDHRVVAVAVVLSLLVALVCGGIPAWRGTAVDPQDALRGARGGGTGREHHRLLAALVVGEVALSLTLLIGAGLVLKGFAQLMRQDPGFDAERVLTLEATVSLDQYPDGSAVRRFVEPALAAIRRVPAVEEAAAISLLPYESWGWNFNIRYEGEPGDDPTQRPLVENRVVTPAFFGVTKQRLVAGRLLDDSDDDRPEAATVVVVNEALAKRDFPGRDPVGQRFHTGDTTFATIVGVVSDIRNVGPYRAPHPEVYRSFRQSGAPSTVPILVRVARGDPAAVITGVRAAIRSVDASAAVTNIRTMPEVMAQSLGRPRFYLTLFGAFAAVALVLAVSGIYGVLSYAVAQRTREFGIRTALGSSAARILTLVAAQGLGLVALGIVFGLAGGFAVTRLMESLLYGISPLDAAAWSLATLALAAAALVAALLPAWRATRSDPLVAMRVE